VLDNFKHFLEIDVFLRLLLRKFSHFIGPKHWLAIFAVLAKLDKRFVYWVKESLVVNMFSLSKEFSFEFVWFWIILDKPVLLSLFFYLKIEI